MYKALSTDFGNGGLLMGEVRKSESDVLKDFGVDKLPTLIIIPPGKDSIIYDGKLKYQPLYDYLSTFALKNNNNKKAKDNSNKNENEKKIEKESPVKLKGKRRVYIYIHIKMHSIQFSFFLIRLLLFFHRIKQKWKN